MDFEPGFRHRETEELALFLARLLVASNSLNQFMDSVLPRIGRSFGTEKVILVDYYENSDHFSLLFFEGYENHSRYRLQREMESADLRRALSYRAPFRSGRYLLIPCYFRDILEALLVLEGADPVEETSAAKESAALVSRILGLFMSSTRLEVNRYQQFDRNDLEKARQIQLNFLPRRKPATRRCEIFGLNQSSNLVGGDYFDYFDHHQNIIQCILADACGHGLAAALIMSNFRGLLQSEVNRETNFSGLFNSLNELVHLDDEQIQYLTGVFLHLDEETGILDYLNAGHYEPVLIRPGGEARNLSGGGPPLGMFRNSQYPLCRCQLEPGDLIFLFTDGIVDVQAPSGDYFGQARLLESICRHRGDNLEELANQVLDDARRFAGTPIFEDDATLFFMRVR